MYEKCSIHVLIGVGFSLLFWIKENSACNLNDKNDVNTLEKFVNLSIPERHIQEKLYSLFDRLEEAKSDGKHKKSIAGVNYMFMLMYPKNIQSKEANPGNHEEKRKRRHIDCKEVERKSNQELEGLRDEIKKLQEGYNERHDFLSKGVCDNKCNLLCSKVSCNQKLCPFRPEEPTCADPLACPKGCSAHWLAQKTIVANKNHSAKSRLSIWRRTNRKMAYLDRDFRGLKRYQYLNEMGSLQKSFKRSKIFEFISNVTISKRAIIDLLEILDYFKEDVTPNMNGTLVPYSTIADSLTRKNQIIEKGVKAIIGHIIPPTPNCQEISKELNKSGSTKGMFQDAFKRIEEKFFQAESRNIEAESCDCKERCGSDAMKEMAKKVIDCSYECTNNAYPCRGYHCRCVFINSYSLKKVS